MQLLGHRFPNTVSKSATGRQLGVTKLGGMIRLLQSYLILCQVAVADIRRCSCLLSGTYQAAASFCEQFIPHLNCSSARLLHTPLAAFVAVQYSFTARLSEVLLATSQRI